jgi:hypothetical protein
MSILTADVAETIEFKYGKTKRMAGALGALQFSDQAFEQAAAIESAGHGIMAAKVLEARAQFRQFRFFFR